ncbi:nitroreductase [Companilactobacillus metriopterae]|uniref:nitroreductase n=1 Tax=Companilactobacillus metriopterae TaxID=1909267 RepID=UPI00100B5996|nr:nitroreductase [Companilactobacillus metriopterae]
MEFLNVLNNRRAIRSFSNQPISDKDLREIVEQALLAPSWENTQPWKVYIAGGNSLKSIKQQHLQYSKDKVRSNPEMPIMHYNQWAKDSVHNIDQWNSDINSFLGDESDEVGDVQFKLFNAADIVYLTVPKNSSSWSIYDLGSFGQTLMLSATNKGIDSIPAYALVKYPDIVRKNIDIPDDQMLVMGIALGYRDTSKINDFESRRMNLDDVLKIEN